MRGTHLRAHRSSANLLRLCGPSHNGGHIDRRADPGNRRRNVVTLTASGERYLEEIQRHADAAQDELLAGLSATERQQLNQLLAKLLASHIAQPA